MLREDSLAEMLGRERDQMAKGPGSVSGGLLCRNLEIWDCAFSHLINQCLLSDEGPQGEGTQALNINDQSLSRAGSSPESFVHTAASDAHSYLGHRFYRYAHSMDMKTEIREVEPLVSGHRPCKRPELKFKLMPPLLASPPI